MAAGADADSEFARIRHYLRPLAAGDPGARALADDGAYLPQGAAAGWAVTTDTLIAGIHFLEGDAPDSLAMKLLGVNLSDLAAMAARPAFYTLNLSLPASCDACWWRTFADGLGAAQVRHGLHLLGGDCTATPGPATLSATLFGVPPNGGPLGRSGLRVGDRLWVSGTIGDATLGLRLLTGGLSAETAGLTEAQARHLADRYRHPRPRWRLTRALRPWLSAAIDISDGLVADLGHMAAGSGAGIRISAGDVPLSSAAAAVLDRGAATRTSLLAGGDDYELAVAAAPEADAVLPAIAASQGVALTPVGTVVSGSGVACYDPDGAEMAFSVGGWDHGAARSTTGRQ